MTLAMFYVGLAVPSAIAFLAFMGVLIGFSLNNKRLDDLRADMNHLRADMGTLRADMGNLRADGGNLRSDMRDGFAQIGARIDLILEEQKKVAALLAVHEYRLTQVERRTTAQGR